MRKQSVKCDRLELTFIVLIVSAVSSFDKVAARLAFRRRSISENTYDRFPPQLLRHNVDDEACTSFAEDPSKRAVGVVCSNEDLKAIVHRHKRRQSPTASKDRQVWPKHNHYFA